MADENPKNNSILETGLIGAPIAIGAGTGLYRAARAAGITSSRSAAEDVYRSVASGQGLIPNVPRTTDHIAFMNKNARYFATTQGAEAARRSWLEAVRGADPLVAAPFNIMTPQIEAMPATEVPSAISSMMAKHESQLTNKVFRKYYRNLNVLRAQEAAFAFVGPVLPPSVSRSLVPGKELQAAMAPLEKVFQTRATYSWLSRPGWAEEGLGSWSVSLRGPQWQTEFLLPSTSGNLLVEGASQQTRYIAPDVGIFNPSTGKIERMTRSEFFLREIEKSILPDISSGQLRSNKGIEKAIKEARRRTIHTLETIPNLPMSEQTAAMQRFSAFRGSAIDILAEQGKEIQEGPWRYTSAFRQPTEREIGNILETHPLFGGVSPTSAAKGRLQTYDISREFLVPEATAWGRRPESMIREWGLAENAAQSLMRIENGRYARYRMYEAEGARLAESRLSRPHLKTLYVEPERYRKLAQELGMDDGEAIMRRGIASRLTFEGTGRAHLFTVREDLSERLLSGKGVNLTPGEIIGWTREGDPFVAESEMKDFRAVAHSTRARGDYFSLYYRDVRSMDEGQKVFGDLKAVIQTEGDKRFSQVTKALIGGRYSDIDVIASMDELKKDPRKHAQQMLTGMSEVLQTKRGWYWRGEPGPAGASRFAQDLQTIADQFRKAATTVTKQGTYYSHEVFTQEMMNFATRELRLTSKEFAQVFGAVPYALGDESLVKNMVREATSQFEDGRLIARPRKAGRFLQELNRGGIGEVAQGVAQLTYGGPMRLTGAGAMGSLEPRAFDILRGGAFAGIGGDLTTELAARLAFTNPEKLAVQESLSRTLLSMAGEVTPGTGEAIWKVGKPGFAYSASEFGNFIARGGGWIDPGKGLRSIYVPGAEVLEAMRPYMVGDMETRSALADTYHDLAQRLDLLYSDVDRITPEMAQRDIESTARQLWKQAAPGGKGMGSVLRGKLLGSRFLTGVSKIGSTTQMDLVRGSSNVMVAGITESVAKRMFGEMSDMYGESAMSAMKQRFMEGEEIGGLVGRHPFIGEFSLQPVRFKKVGLEGDQIILPNLEANIRLRGEGQARKINLGPLIGMAGDKDADAYSAMLVSPDNEKALRKATLSTDSKFLERYMQHQVRYQLLKAGKGDTLADEALTIRQLMSGDVRKIGTVQNWVPQLSVELSAAKRALRARGGAGAADASMLLEWLEQTPISAKHLSSSDVRSGALSATLEAITGSLEARRAVDLEAVVNTIIKDDATARELLTSNVTIESGADEIARITGAPPSREIKAVNIRRATETIMQSLRDSTSSGEARRAELAVARGSGMSIREIPEVVARSASHMAAAGQGVFANVSRAATAASNYLGALGQNITKLHKPIGFGFAASIAVAAALSDPPQLVGPGAGFLPLSGVNMRPGKAADRMKPEHLVPNQEIGKPTVPNSLAQQRSLISNDRQSRYVVNASGGAGVNIAGISSQLAGAGSSLSVNLRDSTSISNPYLAGNKVY